MNSLTWHIEKRNIDELANWEKNPRKISKKNYDRLKNRITKRGFHDVIKIDENNVVLSGNQRLRALKDLGKNEVNCMVPDRAMTDKEKDEVGLESNIADGETDFDILANEFDIDVLQEAGYEDLSFLDEDIVLIQDEAPDINTIKDPVAKLGDIYQLGVHILMCGDSANALDIEKLLDGQKPALVVTDPPYGVNYDPEWRDGCDLGVGDRSKGKVMNDDVVDWSTTFSMIDANVLYVWHAGKFSHEVAKGIIDCGYEIISQIIWAKQHFVLSRGDYHWKHEPCWYAVKKAEKHNWQGARDQSTIWEIKNNNSFGNSKKEETWGHGTQKPIECMMRPILNNSKQGEIVCDPFLGSGTTLLACEQAHRVCYGMEIDPHYVEIIIARWEKFTGKTAIKIN